MIYSLSGFIEYKLPTALVVNVNDIGYMVHCTTQTINQHQLEETIKLLTYHHIREDNQLLLNQFHEAFVIF